VFCSSRLDTYYQRLCDALLHGHPFLCSCCCNLSGGVALIVWFTTNGMCVKNNIIIYVARASNSKKDCDVKALPILTCERLNVTRSVRKERLRAWSLLLLAATVRSFAHIPIGISDRIIVNDDTAVVRIKRFAPLNVGHVQTPFL